MWSHVLDFISNPWVGYGFAIVLLVLQFKMNWAWANVLLVAAWGLFVISAFRTEPILHQFFIPRLLWTALFASAVGLAFYYLLWTGRPAPIALPEIALRFVYPKSPALVIVNSSNSLARDVKWTVYLWNMDLPDRDDPLPIPISTFDWIKPHQESGPLNLFSGPNIAPLLKPGNRLFGSASVNCPNCVRGRTYIVYIVYGNGGWVSEVEDEKEGRLIIPRNPRKETREEYFKNLEARIPNELRIPISER
jgi:hypothetical protein